MSWTVVLVFLQLMILLLLLLLLLRWTLLLDRGRSPGFAAAAGGEKKVAR